MRRLLALVAASSFIGLGLAAAPAEAAQQTPLPLALGGCVDTPLALTENATVTRTCASWDGVNLALWIEGSGLAQEFTVVGSAGFDLFGYLLTIEACAGMRAAPFGGWEAFVELTKPFSWGPLTVPLQVAEDGSRVTMWLNTAGLTSQSRGMGTDAAGRNAFTLSFIDHEGAVRGSATVPMTLSSVRPPALPSPDLHPSTPMAPPAGLAAPGHGSESAPAPLRTIGTSHPGRPDSAVGVSSAAAERTSRIAVERASMGRY